MTEADRRCQFSALAESDLEDIALYVASDNPPAALRWVDELRGFCQTLTNFPAKYRLREE